MYRCPYCRHTEYSRLPMERHLEAHHRDKIARKRNTDDGFTFDDFIKTNYVSTFETSDPVDGGVISGGGGDFGGGGSSGDWDD